MNYGLMHTALLFGAYHPPSPLFSRSLSIFFEGDKVVDWGDYSVVTPRQIIVMRPKLTIDLCDIDLERDQVKMWKVSYPLSSFLFPLSFLFFSFPFAYPFSTNRLCLVV